jgi:uncharacterized protein (DUF58 family)
MKRFVEYLALALLALLLALIVGLLAWSAWPIPTPARNYSERSPDHQTVRALTVMLITTRLGTPRHHLHHNSAPDAMRSSHGRATWLRSNGGQYLRTITSPGTKCWPFSSFLGFWLF